MDVGLVQRATTECSALRSKPRPFSSQAINLTAMLELWSRDSLLTKRRIRDRKVASSSSGRISSSGVNFLCLLLLGVRSTPVLPQWHVKHPGHSAKSAGGRLHLKTHTLLTQRSRSGLTMVSIVCELNLLRKRIHTQLVKKHSATVVSAR